MENLNLKPVNNPQKMSSYWKREWRVVALIVLTGTCFNAAMSLGPILQGQIIDRLLAGERSGEVRSAIGVFLLAILIIQGMRFLKRYYVRIFANRTDASMRQIVYHNLIQRNLLSLNDETSGDLMTKAISDVDACVEGMRKFTTEVFDTGILMISYAITMLYYDVKLTLWACVMIPAAMILAEKLKKVIFKYTKAYRKQLSNVSEQTYETVENAMLYRIYSAEATNMKRYEQELEQLEKKAVLSNMLENSMQPIYNVIAMTGVFIIVYFGGRSVMSGHWTVGTFSAYLTIFTALAAKASKAAKLFNSVQKAQVSWRRIKPYLEPSSDRALPADSSVSDFSVSDSSVSDSSVTNSMVLSVQNMSFFYPGSEQAALCDITFTAKSGDLIGVTGPVAGGKSTLGLALLGLYPYSGSICLNEKELRNCSAGEISKHIAYMGHDSQLLSDTIYHNITLGSDGDIMPVLHDVCFDSDLSDMPLGIETPVGASGVRLSGGQQARLALARALYRQSPILVLDDPFSAVDTKTEAQIIHNLKQHDKERIIILISHRISCFSDSDSVIFVENGHAICASHQILLDTSDVYRTLVSMQKEVHSYE
ncbi:MAG: ABC transporter ATP-binding protein [Clostridium sp.]